MGKQRKEIKGEREREVRELAVWEKIIKIYFVEKLNHSIKINSRTAIKFP